MNPSIKRSPGGQNRPGHKEVHNRQTGASLLEVLVAVLLVSVGLLGVAGLSGATFAYNKNAQIRLVGMGLVNDYADRARVNIFGYDRGGYDITKGMPSPGVVQFTTQNADSTDNASAADLVAQYDRRDFLEAVKNRLPQGTAVVESVPEDTSRGMNVWLLWKEPQNEEDALFNAAKENCPRAIRDSATDSQIYSCMYFKVGL